MFVVELVLKALLAAEGTLYGRVHSHEVPHGDVGGTWTGCLNQLYTSATEVLETRMEPRQGD